MVSTVGIIVIVIIAVILFMLLVSFLVNQYSKVIRSLPSYQTEKMRRDYDIKRERTKAFSDVVNNVSNNVKDVGNRLVDVVPELS